MTGLVYRAINAIIADLAVEGIRKGRHNEEQNYDYRGIDDVVRALAPRLARHQLCILPRVLEREAVREQASNEVVVVLRVAFDLVSALDGSVHVVESFGEAIDDGNKATAKAMSAAYKAAMLQAFCIPVPHEDEEESSTQLDGRGGNTSGVAVAEPPEGWSSWSDEVIHIAASCETAEAIDLLLRKRRGQLAALQRSRPELYAKLGEAIATSLAALEAPKPAAGAVPRDKHAKREDAGGRRARAEAA